MMTVGVLYDHRIYTDSQDAISLLHHVSLTDDVDVVSLQEKCSFWSLVRRAHKPEELKRRRRWRRRRRRLGWLLLWWRRLGSIPPGPVRKWIRDARLSRAGDQRFRIRRRSAEFEQTSMSSLNLHFLELCEDVELQ